MRRKISLIILFLTITSSIYGPVHATEKIPWEETDSLPTDHPISSPSEYMDYQEKAIRKNYPCASVSRNDQEIKIALRISTFEPTATQLIGKELENAKCSSRLLNEYKDTRIGLESRAAPTEKKNKAILDKERLSYFRNLLIESGIEENRILKLDSYPNDINNDVSIKNGFVELHIVPRVNNAPASDGR